MQNLKSYLITDPNYFSSNPQKFEEKLKIVLTNHKVDFACFRDKSSQNFEELAKIFLDICKDFKIENILLNSNINLANRLKFDGVHLNSKQFDDIKVAKSLNLLTIISCHNFEDLNNAIKNSIDLVTFSPIFETPNKGDAKGVEKLNEAIQKFPDLKIIALGGIISKEHIEKISQTKSYGFSSIRYFI